MYTQSHPYGKTRAYSKNMHIHVICTPWHIILDNIITCAHTHTHTHIYGKYMQLLKEYTFTRDTHYIARVCMIVLVWYNVQCSAYYVCMHILWVGPCICHRDVCVSVCKRSCYSDITNTHSYDKYTGLLEEYAYIRETHCIARYIRLA